MGEFQLRQPGTQAMALVATQTGLLPLADLASLQQGAKGNRELGAATPRFVPGQHRRDPQGLQLGDHPLQFGGHAATGGPDRADQGPHGCALVVRPSSRKSNNNNSA